MSSGEQLTIVIVALLTVSKIVDWVLVFTRGHQKQDQDDTAERLRWMTMLETVLEDNRTNLKTSLDETTKATQTNMTTALEQMFGRMDGRMAEVGKTRDAKLELMHTDLKTVPGEVRRVLADDFTAQTTAIQNAISATSESHQDVIRDAISSALKPLLEQIDEKIDQMPGAETARAIIRAEIGSLQQQLVDQVAVQITPLFEKLEEIAATLDKLQPPQKETEAGEQTPADTSIKGEDNHVGNPS